MARVWQDRVARGECQPAGTVFLGVTHTGAPSPFLSLYQGEEWVRVRAGKTSPGG